ncbi:MAG: nickel transporter [Hyphomicrobiales bacterium]|nr:nickel transporter [Hyphomicrobiales bacterium]
MIVVPVVDLKQGAVVRARRGDRAAYRPIETPLAEGSDPVEVVHGLLSVYPFPHLYIADIDAIQGRGDNFAVLPHLRRAFPRLRLWVDSGVADAEALQALVRSEVAFPVVGSETQRDVSMIAACKDRHGVVLSLDFIGDVFQGPPELLAEPRLWPNRVIVMSLAQVGTAGGPDFARLASILAAAGARQVFAAGGVRHFEDLAALAGAGAAGALVATALHNGSLTKAEVEAVESTAPGSK